MSSVAVGSTGASAATTGVKLSAGPLGIDVAPWDGLYSPNYAGLSKIQAYLKAADITQIHYGGGVSADQYDWQTNTDISSCPDQTMAEYSAACAYTAGLDFAALSKNARAIGAQTFATVNYGAGTVAEAQAWAKQAATTSGQQVAEFEIGNESYGCWENNIWLASKPTDYPGYVANNSATCPLVAQVPVPNAGMTTMATSYAYNAGLYMAAMHAADPSAKLGIPYANDASVGGATVADNTEWNNTILKADAKYIGFVDEHWYPFGFAGATGGANPTDQQVIQSVEQIPTEYKNIRAALATGGDPSATVTVGETGVSYLATGVTCTPAGALFSAGDVLSWLAAGATSVDWWPLDTDANKTSTCANPDEGMFTNAGAPDTAYTGYLLASQLAQPSATLSALATSNPAQVLGYQSTLSSGHVVVALINTNTATAEKVTVPSSLTGNLSTTTYSAANQNATNSKTVTGTTTAATLTSGITLPAESVTIIKEGLKPSAMTMAATAKSYKAGAKVTIKGKLTLNGVAAPKGVAVKIYRRAAGSTTNSATLTAKVGANGDFAATDVPSAKGTWDYVGNYTSSTYVPATATVAVKVTAAAPSLKVGVSAGSVKPGKKITVTATLGAPHANKTLVIYAQAKGGSKKVIKKGTVNAKGQVSVAFTVKANTTFTVTFAGDSWYTAATKSVAVKA